MSSLSLSIFKGIYGYKNDIHRSYVHCIKCREALQGHSGSFISCDGTFGEVVWKGSTGVHEPGGTPKKLGWQTELESSMAVVIPVLHSCEKA